MAEIQSHLRDHIRQWTLSRFKQPVVDEQLVRLPSRNLGRDTRKFLRYEVNLTLAREEDVKEVKKMFAMADRDSDYDDYDRHMRMERMDSDSFDYVQPYDVC